MKWFINLKIGKKLLLSFLFVTVITAFLGIEGLTNLRNVNNMLKGLYQQEMIGLSKVKEANVNLHDFEKEQSNYLLTSSREQKQEHLKAMEMNHSTFSQCLKEARAITDSENEKILYTKIDASWNQYKSVVDKLVAR